MGHLEIDHIRRWLVLLSGHVARNQDVGDIAAVIEATAAMLAGKAAPDLFTPDSLEFCLRRFKFFPTYADLWARLQTFQRERDSHRAALNAPSSYGPLSDAPMTGAERANAEVWLKAEASGATEAELVNRLSVLRKAQLDAYRWLIANNGHARDIAEARGWESRERRAPPAEEWGDPAKVLASVRNILVLPHPQASMLLGVLRRIVTDHAPQNAELVPLDPASTYASDERTHQQRQPSAEQRADMAADDGIVRNEPPASSDPLPPARPFGAMTDVQLLAVWQKVDPEGIRTKALAAKVAADAIRPQPIREPI